MTGFFNRVGKYAAGLAAGAAGMLPLSEANAGPIYVNGPVAAQEQTPHFSSPVPTNSWMNTYGNITISGLPAQVGDEVAAFDPQNVLCGLYDITVAGQYGFLHIYGDDTTTPAIDEGASAGDKITFKIFDASENKELSAPQSVTWSALGGQQVNITAMESQVVPEPSVLFDAFVAAFGAAALLRKRE